MRTAFINRLMQLAETDRRIFLITGDLGFGVLDAFAAKFPDQFLNVGVAEQNMTAVATGLALEGHVAFTYSIGNFPTLRCLEQIRNDACYHNANVKVVSIGGGFSYGQLGMSHHATEDLSIMRAIPGMITCAPGSTFETTRAVDALVAHEGPAYLRLERAAADFSDDPGVPFVFGKARMLRQGYALTLIASGGVVAETTAAADQLMKQGIDCRVLSYHSLKPFDHEALSHAARDTGGVVTIEENTVLGGLGGAVAEIAMQLDQRPRRFRRIGIDDTYVSIVGDQSYLRAAIGLDRHGIARTVCALLDSPSVT